MKTSLFALFVLSLFILSSAPLARAATVTVGYDVNELIAAINTANTNGEADALELATGCTYTLTAVDNAGTEGGNGLPVIASDITLDGNGATIKRSSASDTPIFRIFQVERSGTLRLSDVTITGGQVSDGVNSHGGGIYNAGQLVLTNVTLTGNRGRRLAYYLTQSSGGGIFNTGTATISHSTIEQNWAGDGNNDTMVYWVPGGHGGGIYNSGTLVLSGSQVIDNGAGYNEGNGGGIFNEGTLTAQRVLFQGNYAGAGGASDGGSGGGIYNTGELNLAGCQLIGNSAGDGGICTHSYCMEYGGAGGWGGGIYNPNSSGRVTESTISNNRAGNGHLAFRPGDGGSGGGIANGGSLQIVNSTLSDNLAGNGGNAIISSGWASQGGEGGGINSTGTLTLTNTTVHHNSPGSGGQNAGRQVRGGQTGGVAITGGTATLKNSIIANNPQVNCSGSIEDGDGNLRWPLMDASCVGRYGDPVLGPLQDNGGPTWTMALGAGSTALETGVPANCPATDQRGIPRPDPPGTPCDAGAFESNLPPPPIAVVENEDPRIQYNGWRGVSDANANGGTYRVSKVKNDKVTVKFTGTSVTWVTKKGPNQGKVQVTNDGVAKGRFDLYSPTAQWNVQQTFKALTNMPHTLVVKVLGQKNKSATDTNVIVDAFAVGGATTQDTDPSVQYNSWIGTSDSTASGGTYRSSSKQGAIVSLTFNATSINWITAMGPNYGKAQVLIDTKVVDTVDLYAATQQWQVVKTYGGLSAWQHTIQIKVLGSKNKLSKGKMVVVDAFSGPITTTGTSVQVEPEVEDSSSSDTSWLFWMPPLGIASLVIVRRRF